MGAHFNTDILIVGGGLCGLRLATLLEQSRRDYILAEAKDRVGGRAYSELIDLAGRDASGAIDLGPAWIWPHQKRVRALIAELGLETFEQYSEGDLVFQDARAPSIQRLSMATMAGSLRVVGGMQSIADRMVERLPDARVRINARLVALERDEDEGSVHATFANGDTIHCERVVLAMPPRIAARHDYSPVLPPALVAAMTNTPTWMAGHAKAVAVYETPFWREENLSGDGMSRRGPLVEIHDASPNDASFGALFGFFGTPYAWREQHRAQLDAIVIEQLAQMYGERARTPLEVHLMEWANDSRVATAQDQSPPPGHPHYRPISESLGAWEGALLLSGTEVASEEGGYVEGALVAAEDVWSALGLA